MAPDGDYLSRAGRLRRRGFSGSKPIEGVGTSVAGFIGFAEKGPYNTPALITNWTQYRNTFGDFIEGAYLPHSVYGYFNNGGGVCYVVRLGEENGKNGNVTAQPAQRLIPSRSASSGGQLKVSAIDAGHANVVVEVSAATV